MHVRIPTIYEYALFCKIAYPEENERDEILPTNLINSGWEYYDRVPQNEYGYTGVAFRNRDIRHVVIAHCGTRFDLLQNVKVDLKIASRLLPWEECEHAINYSKRIRNELGNTFTYSETGHSLGGVFAQISAYINNDNGIGVDNPGTLDLIKKYYERHGLKNEKIKPERTRKLTSYLSAPNFINTSGPHAGKIIRVYPYHINIEGHSVEGISSFGWVSHKALLKVSSRYTALILKFFGKQVARAASGLGSVLLGYEILNAVGGDLLTQTKKLHSLNEIINTIDPDIQEPYIQTEMKTWPGTTFYADRILKIPVHILLWIRDDCRLSPRSIRRNRSLEDWLASSKITGYQHPSKDSFILPDKININNFEKCKHKRFVNNALIRYLHFYKNDENYTYFRSRLSSLFKVEINEDSLKLLSGEQDQPNENTVQLTPPKQIYKKNTQHVPDKIQDIGENKSSSVCPPCSCTIS